MYRCVGFSSGEKIDLAMVVEIPEIGGEQKTSFCCWLRYNIGVLHIRFLGCRYANGTGSVDRI